MFAIANAQLAENLLAIRKSGEWRSFASSFEVYVVKRWSLSKSRAKLLCDFATFYSMCRSEYLPLPDSPDNVKPLLQLPQKRWLDLWRMFRTVDRGVVNAQKCQALLDHFGVVSRKKLPAHVLNGRRVRKAAQTLADLGDGEKLVEQIGPDRMGKNWDSAVTVVIDADNAKRTRERRHE